MRQGAKLFGISPLPLLGQGDQRSAIVDGGNRAKQIPLDLKEIRFKESDPLMMEGGALWRGFNNRVRPPLLEEIDNSLVAELNAGNGMPERPKMAEIETFSRQGNQDLTLPLWHHPSPVPDQQGMDL